MEWQVSKIWSGVCWVIGGGGSIAEQFNVPRNIIPEDISEFRRFGEYLKPIHNDHIIGVNLAAFLGDWVDIAFWGDTDTYNMYKGNYDDFGGLKVSCSPKFANKDIKSVKYLYRNIDGGLKNLKENEVSWPHLHIDIDGKKRTVNAGNSGVAAISLAVQLGCTEIRLLGFDMKNGESGRIHFHTGYPQKDYVLTNKMVKAGNIHVPRENKITAPYERHLLSFDKIAKDAKELGISIINVNPDSAIECFEKKSLSDLVNIKDIIISENIKETENDCPICENSVFIEHDNVNGIPVVFCENCKTFKQKVNEDLDDYYYEQYHSGVYSHTIDQDKKVADLRLNQYKQKELVNKIGTYLDFGSGNGAFVSVCRENGLNCFGVEANKESETDFVYCSTNLKDINFPTEYFNTIFIHDVLEHLQDPVETLKEIHRILIQDGILVLEYPDFYSEYGKHHWKLIEHIWMIKKDVLSELLERIGFCIKETYNPIPGKFVLICKAKKQETISILVPPGIGDIQWVLVKLQSFLKINEIKTIPDVYVCSFDEKKDRSIEYLKQFPFINAKGYKYLSKNEVPWKEAYIETGKTVFKNIGDCDYFIAYNGQLREPKTLDQIDSKYVCNYDLPMFESKYQIKYGYEFKEKHGNYIVGYFIDHGVYKRDWLDVLTPNKLVQILDILGSDLNCKIVLIGSEWDVDCYINKFITNCFCDRVINMIGKTNTEEVFGIIKNSNGVIGFPSGITIMSTYFKIPTYIFWSEYFNEVFWEASCYPISKSNTYDYCSVENVNIATVVSDFKKISNKPKTKNKYVVCVLKSGGDYTSEYVEKLRKGVINNLTHGFKFRCFTDLDKNKINIPNEEIIELTDNLPGWWSKLEIFKSGLFDNGCQVLYFDLDTVIINNIDYLFDIGSGFYMLEGFAKNNPHASGIMFFDSDLSFIYNDFNLNKNDIMYKNNETLKGDQNFIQKTYAKIIGKFPFKIKRYDNILSFKKSVLNQKITNDKLKNLSIICFHGKPRPHEVVNDLIKQYWS